MKSITVLFLDVLSSKDKQDTKCEARDIYSGGVLADILHLVPRILCLVVIYSLCASQCHAQFIPYSQYYNAPLLTNPSLAALSEFTQLTVHYRRSRVANYEIPSVAFVHPFYRHRDGLRAGAIGANVIGQFAGPAHAYQTTGFLGTFAYNIHLSKKHHISAGLQGGVINKKLDPSGLTTDNQFNLGAFDPSLSTGENLQANSVVKPLINSGFTYSLTDSSNMPKVVIGVAFANMNRPSYELLSGSNTEDIIYTISGEVLLLQKGRSALYPTFRYISGVSPFANIGVQLRYKLAGKSNDISLGAWYKTTNALVGALQYSERSYTLGVSMDFSASADLQANVNNALEVSFGWRLKRKVRSVKPASTSLIISNPNRKPQVIQEEEEIIEEENSVEEPDVLIPNVSNAGPEVVDTEPMVVDVEPEHVAPEQVNKITPEERLVLQKRISFKLGSSDLTDESIAFIETDLLTIVKNHPDHILQITGHSCTIGDRAINEKISLHRAEVIAQRLLHSGIPKESIVVIGMDFEKPIASNATEEGRMKNRRAEFQLIPKQ